MQVPGSINYERAASVEDALGLLERLGPESRIIAGGHSLLPMMKLRLARPEVLIDINDLTDLSYVRKEADELAIGAMTRHRELLASELAGRYFPILHDAERVIADPVVRNRGTIGGSLCQADPSEDLSAAFAALKATAVVRSSSGSRRVPMAEFHEGPYTTVLGPAEMLVEVRIPIRAGAGSAYEKVERRVGDWAIAAVGAYLCLNGDHISEAGIGLAAVGADHFRAERAEAALQGSRADDASFAEAARLASEECEPVSDQRGPADYKRHLVSELTARALRTARARADERKV